MGSLFLATEVEVFIDSILEHNPQKGTGLLVPPAVILTSYKLPTSLRKLAEAVLFWYSKLAEREIKQPFSQR